MAALGHLSDSVNIGLLELRGLPCTSSKHLSCQLSLKLCASWLIVGSLGHLVRFGGGDVDQLTLFEQIDDFLVVAFDFWCGEEFAQLLLVFILELLGDSDDEFFLGTGDLHPFVLHGLREADFGDLGTNLRLNFSLWRLSADSEC